MSQLLRIPCEDEWSITSKVNQIVMLMRPLMSLYSTLLNDSYMDTIPFNFKTMCDLVWPFSLERI